MLLLRPLSPRSGRRAGAGLSINRWAILALPAIGFLVVFFLAPLIIVGQRSVTDFPKPTHDTFSNYVRFFAAEANLRVLANTFWVAAISTVACLAIGYPYAYLMNIMRPRVAGLLLIAVLVPDRKSVV